MREELSRKAERRTTWVLWGGMAYMATQFGILARLTWWEYSWDIMEPVTYFITYGTAMAMYAYFVLTRQVRHKSTVIVWVAVKNVVGKDTRRQVFDNNTGISDNMLKMCSHLYLGV